MRYIMPVMEHLRRPKTLPQLKRERKREEKQLDILAGIFGGGVAVLAMLVLIMILF